MTALYILLAIFIVFFLILMIRPHITICARENTDIYVKVLFFRKRVFTTRKRVIPDTDYKPESPKKKKEKNKDKKEKKQDTKLGILELLELIKDIALSVIKKIKKYLRIRVKSYFITVSTDDAANTATLYGAVYAASGAIFDILGRAMDFKTEKNAKVDVRADFLAQKTKTDIEIDLSVTLFQVIKTALAALVIYLKKSHESKRKNRENEVA
ncbi:MAG: DUF2953 domain-containing protein [Eubacteriales bacterium]